MRRTLLPVVLALAGLWIGTLGNVATGQSPKRQLTSHQAHQLALLVAHHDDIDLSDTHVELNSMDMGSEFTPGFFSFIVIRESTSPGPDETLRRYAINRRTGDVWEMTLCTHYAFPELERMRQEFAGRAALSSSELSAQGKRLGCSIDKGAPTS